MSPWIPVIVQIGLGLATLVGSGVVVHGLNTRKERREFLRSKLEDLLEAVVSLERRLGVRMRDYRLVISQKLQFEETDTLKRETRKSAFEYYVKIEMLIRLYFPDLLPKYIELRDLRLKAGTLEMRIERSAKAIEDLSVFHEPYCTVFNSFEPTVEGLKSAIRKQGEKLKLFNTG